MKGIIIRSRAAVLVALLACLFSISAAAAPFQDQTPLWGDFDTTPIAVSTSGGLVAAATLYSCPEPDFALASCAGVLLYQKVQGAWTEVALLRQSSPGAIDAFGASISVSGDVVAVGAWGHDCGEKFQCGSVYIYKKPAGGWKDMTETARVDGSAEF
ncbi:MAG TPA: FG-GAP repeat protein, partial [Gammaproteobacteria bacterium]